MEQVSLLGVILAPVFYAISASPSLLPRRWWWHGFVSGPLMALGYSIGWALTNAFKWIGQVSGIEVTGPAKLFDAIKLAVIVVAILWSIWSSVRAYYASRRAAKMVDIKAVGPKEYLLALLATAVMFIATMALVYLLTEIFELIVSIVRRYLPPMVSWLVAVAGAIAVVLIVSNKVVFKLMMAYFAKAAQSLNDRSNSHLDIPSVPERSGSEHSSSSWESIGGQGRLFLGHGPSAEKIAEVTGRPAIEPVRVYVGLPKGEKDLRRLAQRAVEELRRAGGFNRSVIVVYTATGSGWVDEWIAQPLEYMTGGDCATVSMQYSYLFSAAMMVSDLGPCAEAGTVLFEAVEAEVLQMPKEERPLLMVAGESLGSHGSQAAFTDAADLNHRVDGALWVGPPYRAPLSSALIEGRQKGSPEVVPVIDSGKHIRFSPGPGYLHADLYGREYGRWEFPRTVIVQHASDPVVHYKPSIAFQEPDWLRERVGPDVSPSMRYTPIATFLQIVADLPVAGLAPAGHGHTYHRELIDVWIGVLGLDEESVRGSLVSGQWISAEVKERIAVAIETDLRRYNKGMRNRAEDTA